MEESKETVTWREQVNQNVKRLQSLLFGADHFLENRDFSSAQVLWLRLIGFLDSHSLSDLDETFTRPIRREAVSKLDSARRSLISESDRYITCLSLSLSILSFWNENFVLFG